MVSYKDYMEIKSIAIVHVINFHDEHNGVGISLKDVADKGYNAFTLVKFAPGYSKEECILALEDYIATSNAERVANGYKNMMDDKQYLILHINPTGHMYAIPFCYYKTNKRTMFSGAYIIGDSSMSSMLGHHYPIGVHNRVE